MRATTLLAGVVAVIVLVGCGPGATGAPGATIAAGPTGGATTAANPTEGALATQATSTDAPSALPDPCSLITQEEAAVAVAAPVAAGVSEGVGRPEFGSGEQCSFSATEGEGAARVGVWPNPGTEIWQIYRAGFGPVPELPGADADEAITVGNGLCVVLKGDVLMEVTVASGDGYATDPAPRMKVLCLAAAARL